MDVLEEDHPDAELTYAPVIAEVSFKDSDGDHCSSYRWRSTADSPAMTAGVAYMVVRGATEPD